MHQLPGETRVFDRIYRRAPRGLARLCVAAASGALFATLAVLRRNGEIGQKYWYIFAGWGLAIGLVGGSVLGVLERREAAGQPPPLWWSVLRRVSITFLQLLCLCLLMVLFYVMYRVVRDNHLYGF